ncbi:hypothetical protein DNTS_024020, partial [Danionella cerebrum]
MDRIFKKLSHEPVQTHMPSEGTPVQLTLLSWPDNTPGNRRSPDSTCVSIQFFHGLDYRGLQVVDRAHVVKTTAGHQVSRRSIRTVHGVDFGQMTFEGPSGLELDPWGWSHPSGSGCH